MRRTILRLSRKTANGGRYLVVMSAITTIVFNNPVSAQSWTREGAGVLIYQRDVPTQPAQIVGEPAPPDQVILSGPDSPFDPIANIGSTLSDLEAGQITGQSPAMFDVLAPQAPAPSMDPEGVAGYATSLASSVATATQNTVANTVNQVTSVLNSTTSSITSALSSLPSAGDF